jgi:hypothetical protein
MNPICQCDICKRHREDRLIADLNAMADRRQDAYSKMFNLDAMRLDKDAIPVQTEWQPKWKLVGLLVAGCAFAVGLAYESIKYGLWLFLK